MRPEAGSGTDSRERGGSGKEAQTGGEVEQGPILGCRDLEMMDSLTN